MSGSGPPKPATIRQLLILQLAEEP